jgi:hypothetical protein
LHHDDLFGTRYAQPRVLNFHLCRWVLVHNLITIPLRYFERGKHRAVDRIQQFFQLCFAASLDHIDSE